MSETIIATDFHAIVLKDTDQVLIGLDDGQAKVYESERDANVAFSALSSAVRKLTVVKKIHLIMDADMKDQTDATK